MKHLISSKSTIDAKSRLRILLYAVISVGMLTRILSIVVLSPLDPTWLNSEDAVRHMRDARSLDHLTPLGNIDLPLYQIWLHQFIFNSRLALCMQTLLSLLTPTIWWLWMRRCLPTKMLALVGFAALTWLPSWIAIFSFFMPETILLPLAGLALFLSAESNRRNSTVFACLAAVAWGLASSVKLTIFPCFLTTLIVQLRQSKGATILKRDLLVAGLQLVIIALCYAVIPLRNFEAFHSLILTPAVLPYSEAYYLSGRQTLKADFKFEDREGKLEHAVIFIRSPCVLPTIKVLEPLSDWQSSRVGDYLAEVDYRTSTAPAKPHCDFQKRMQLTWENWLFFYFSDSSPDDLGTNIMCAFEHQMRWFWLPLSLMLFGVSIFLRKITLPLSLAAVTTLMFLCQQSWILEGRYRKPLEGLLIVSFLGLMHYALNHMRGRTLKDQS